MKYTILASALVLAMGSMAASAADVVTDENKTEIEKREVVGIGNGEWAGTTVQSYVSNLHLQTVMFTGAKDPSSQNKAKGYIKNWNGNIQIDKVDVVDGVSGTLEYWGTKDAAPVTGVHYAVGTVDIGAGSTLFVQTSQDKDKNEDGKYHDALIGKKSSLHIGTLNMTGSSTLRLGYVEDKANTGSNDPTDVAKKNKIGAAEQRIDTINVAIDEATKAQTAATITTNVNPTVYVNTINIGNGKLDLGGAQYNNHDQGGVNLVGSVTVNMLDAGSEIKFGSLGGSTDFNLVDHANDPASSNQMIRVSTEPESKTVPTHVTIAYAPDALTNEGSAVTFSEALNEDTTITALAVGVEDGDARQKALEAVATKTFSNNTNWESGKAQAGVAAAGIHDGVIYDVAQADEGDGFDFTNGRTVENPVTHGFSQLAAVGYMQWRSAMNHMQYRMGEIRDHNGYNNGAWARLYNGKDEYGSQNVENKYFGVQTGYDHRLEGTDVVLGAAFSYTHGDSDFDAGEGDNYNYDITFYGTWLAENGMFLDGTLKYGRLSNDITMAEDTASYDTNAMSVSIEAGWRFPVTDLFYVEPQAELMYGHVWSADYDYGDFNVTNEALDTTVGRLGVMAGLTCLDKKGSVWMRASVLNDFQGDADVTFRQGSDKTTISEELGDTWYELGIGAQYNMTDATYLYADFNYADGGEIESPWRWSLGVRHAF